jgi:ketosteroid isomerase-like protein
MKKFTPMITGLIFIFGNAVFIFAQANDSKIVEQIMKLEAEHIEASKKLNAADFNRIETDDFIMTVRIPPKIITKAENSARLKDPNFKRGTIESLTNDDVKVRVYNNDTAISTGSWKRTSKDADGKDTSASGRFTHVWVKQKDKWLLAAAHYSPNIDLEKLKAGNTPPENKN